MPTMHTIEEHEAQQVKPYIDTKVGAVGNVSGDPKTVSYADIVSIKDAIAVNAKDVSIKIEPVQAGSGTPSPDNIRAISGWSSAKVVRAGKNKWSANATVSRTAYQSCSLVFLPAGTYTLSAVVKSSDADAIRCLVNDITNNTQLGLIERSTGTERKAITFTLTKPTSEIGLYASLTYAQSTGDTFSFTDIQLETGSTATEYEPYAGNEYTIDLGGTIYGGTLDVTSGVLTVTHKIINVTSLTGVPTQTSGITRWVDGISHTDIVIPSTSTDVANIISNMFEKESADDTFLKQEGIALLTSSKELCVYSEAWKTKTATEVNEILATTPLQVVCPLATPQVIQLTPTQIRMLAGVNTVYADTGDTQVEYFNSSVGNLGASVGNLGEVIGDVETQIANEVKVRAVNGGGHNIIDLSDDNITVSTNASYIHTDTGLRITNAGASTYKSAVVKLNNLLPDTDYIFSTDVTRVAGAVNILIWDRTTDITLANSVDEGHVELTFNSGSYTTIVVSLYCIMGTTGEGDVTYNDLQVALTIDGYKGYIKPIPTNAQLEANKADIIPSALNSSAISSLDDIPVNSMGRVYFSASDSPTGTVTNMNVLCVGSGDIKTLVCFSGDRLYMKVKGGGSWAPWHSFVSDT